LRLIRGIRYGSLPALVAALAVLLGGCGYALVGRSSNLPEDVESVYIGTLKNETTRVEIDQILTAAVIDEMVKRRRLQVVNAASDADSEIRGTVTRFGVTPVAFDAEGRATEYQVSISLKMLFVRLDTGEELCRRDLSQFREPYPVDESETTYFDRETLALEQVSGTFAETLITDLLEGF
jgi:outer membrane lipopolysaccharide assembly protein LptE/RlpB